MNADNPGGSEPPSLSETVLAIDPGSAKCGVAVVRRDGRVLFRDVVATAGVIALLPSLVEAYRPKALLVGAGTGSRSLLTALAAAGLSVPIERVPESHTSEEARRRFVAENPAQGWQRLLPRSLRTPPRAYDDYVAVILAERWWQIHSQTDP